MFVFNHSKFQTDKIKTEIKKLDNLKINCLQQIFEFLHLYYLKIKKNIFQSI